jgi:hypothetical protein
MQRDNVTVGRRDAADGRASERSLGELFGDLSREMSTLVRQEVSLASTELSQKASAAGKDVGFLAAGGAVAYAGLLVLLAAITLILDQVMPLWLAALLVGAVVIGIGYYLVRQGLDRLKRLDLTPRRTLETLKDDGAWAKEQVT